MAAIGTPDYKSLARIAVETYRRYVSGRPGSKPTHTAREPSSSEGLAQLDFEIETSSAEDKYLYGQFEDGTYVGKLESDVEGEGGLYNIAVDPAVRTPYSLIMPTRDYHPQSAPLRPPYLTHAYRLLVALEEELAGEGLKVLAVYDCGEKSGVRIGHKCIRFYTVEKVTDPSVAYTKQALPSPLPDTDQVELFNRLLYTPQGENSSPFIPPQPHYNLILSREEMIIVPRTDDGFLNEASGMWDGARLCGVDL